MNKIASYLKNLGKSATYATVDIVGNNLIPEIKEFTETNNEVFKVIYAGLSNSKTTLNSAKQKIKENQIYKDLNQGLDNALSDLKSGNLYNKERVSKSIDDSAAFMFGDEDEFKDDFSFDDGFDFDDEDSGSDFDSVTKGDVLVADVLSSSNSASAKAISKTIANSAKSVIEANVSGTNTLMRHNIELISGLRSNIVGLHESVNSILKFHHDHVSNQINNEAAFFGKTETLLEENNNILKEILELKKKTNEEERKGSESKDQFRDIFSGSVLDLKEYFRVIKGNLKNLDSTGSFSMLFNNSMGGSMISHMLANPLGFLISNPIKGLIPKSLANSIAGFSKNMQGLFPAMLTKLNRLKDKDSPLKFLGKIFGIESETKRSIDVSQYQKGEVPFDGLTRKAIVDIIPEHLSKIESLLSGKSQRYYDYEKGKWVNSKDIKKEFDNNYKYNITGAFSEITPEFEKYVDYLVDKQALSYENKKSLEEDFYNIMKSVYEGDGHFAPKQIKKDIYKYGVNNIEMMSNFLDVLSEAPLHKLMNVSSEIFESKRRYGDQLRSDEKSGTSLYRKLFDGSNSNDHLIFNKDIKPTINAPSSNIIINTKDNLGKNILDYLKEITDNISFIRSTGLSTGNKKGSYNNSKIPDFKEFIKQNKSIKLDKELKKIKQQEENEAEYFNSSHYDPTVNQDQASYDAKRYGISKQEFKIDDHDAYGKYLDKFTNKNLEIMKTVQGSTFTEKFKNAKSGKERYAVLMGSLSNTLKKPSTVVEGLIDKANQSIYKLLFETEYDEYLDDKKENVHNFGGGLIGNLLTRINIGFNNMLALLDEKVITPIAKKLGLGEKLDKLKEKLSGTSPVKTAKNALNNIKSHITQDLKKGAGFVKDSVNDVLINPIKRDPKVTEFLKSINDKKIKKMDESLDSILSKMTYEDAVELSERLKTMSAEDQENIPEKVKEKMVELLDKKGDVSSTETHAKGGKSSGKKQKRKDSSLKKKKTRVVVANEDEDVYIDNKQEDSNVVEENAKAENKVVSKILSTSKSINDLNNKNKELDDNVNEESIIVSAIYQEAKNVTDKFLGLNGSEKDKETQINKGKQDLLKRVGSVLGEMKGSGYSTIGKMAIGGGLGLLSGVFGGPIIGAGLGAAYSISKNSATVNKYLFGEESTDENGNVIRKNGLISKKVQDNFKKYAPDAAKFASVGAVSSLLLPFGPLLGAGIGAGIGLLKNSTTMNDILFGDEKGLFNKNRREAIKKAYPKMAIGTIGSMLLGPFGLLGNAVLGSGIGLLSGTEEFKSLILGKENEKGEREGGITGALDEYFVKPVKEFGFKFKEDFFGFIKEEMVEPLNRAITPIATEIAFQTKRVVFGIPKYFAQLAEDKIAIPFMHAIEGKLIKPISDTVTNLFSKGLNGIKNIISAPFKLTGMVGDYLERKQIRQGRSKLGSAKSRVQFADKFGMISHDYKKFDEHLAIKTDNNDVEYLEGLSAQLGVIKDGDKYFDKEMSKVKKEVSKILVQYSKEKWFDKRSSSSIAKMIQNDDIEGALAALSESRNTTKFGKRLSDEEYKAASEKLLEASKNYKRVRDNKDKYKGKKSEIQKQLEKQFGTGLNIDYMYEYATREAKLAKGKNGLKLDEGNNINKVDAGSQKIVDAIYELIDVVKSNKDGQLHGDEKFNENYTKAGKKSINKNLDKRSANYDDIAKTFKLDKEKDRELISKIAEKPEMIKILKKYKNKTGGKSFNKDQLDNITSLNDRQLKVLKKYPAMGELPLDALSLYTDDLRRKNKKQRYLLNDAVINGVEINTLKDARAVGNSNTIKGDRKVRLEYYKKIKALGKHKDHNVKDLLGSNGYDYDKLWELAEGGRTYLPNPTIRSDIHYAKEKIRENLTGSNAKEFINNLSDKVKKKSEKVMSEEIEETSNKNTPVTEKIKNVFTKDGVIKYIRNSRGDYDIANDKETKETIAKQNKEQQSQSGIMATLSSMKDGILGLFNIGKRKDEEEKKEPFFKKLFSFDLGSIKGKLTFGALALAGFTGIGALKNLWSNREEGGVIDNIGSSIKDYLGPVIKNGTDWFTNQGEYSDPSKGFSGFFETHVLNNLFTGFNVIFEKVLPPLIKAFIVNIPTMAQSAISGVLNLIGFGNKNKNDNKLDVNSITSSKSNSSSYSSAIDSSISSSSPSIRTASEQADKVATTINNISSSSSSSNTNNSLNSNNGTVSNTANGNRNTALSQNYYSNNTDESINNDNSNDQAIIADTVLMFKKDENGNLIPMSVAEATSGITEFYTETGARYYYDETTGQFVGENSSNNSALGGFLSNLTNMTIRSAVTGKPMGAVRITNTLGKSKALRFTGRVADKILSKTPIVKYPYKMVRTVAKGSGKLSTVTANIGSKFTGELASSGSTKKALYNTALQTTDNIVKSVSNSKAGNAIRKGVETADKIKNSKATKVVSNVTSKATNVASKTVDAVKNSKAINTVSNVVDNVGTKATNAAKKVVTTSKSAVSNLLSKASDSLAEVTNFISKNLKNIFENNWVINKIRCCVKKKGKKIDAKAAKKLAGEMVEKLLKEIVEKALKKIPGIVVKLTTKIASAATLIIPAALAVADLVVGWDQANSILGVLETSFKEKFIAAIAHVINNQLFFGLIDTPTVATWCINIIFPLIGIDTSDLQERRAEADAWVEEQNKLEGSDKTKEERLKENTITNKISKGWDTVKNTAKNIAGGTVNAVKNSSIGKAVSNVADKVTSAGKAAGDWVVNKAKNVFDFASYAKDCFNFQLKEIFTGQGEGDISVSKDDPNYETKKNIYYGSRILAKIIGVPAKFIGDGIKNIVGGVTKIGGSLGKTAISMITKGWNGDIVGAYTENNDVQGDNAFINGTSKTVNSIAKVMMTGPTLVSAAIGMVARGVKGIVDSAIQVGGGVVNTATSIFTSAWNGNIMEALMNDSTDTSTGNALIDGTSKVVNTITKTVLFVPGMLTSGIGAVARNIGTVIEGIKAIGTGIGDTVTSIMGKALSGENPLEEVFTDEQDAQTGNGFVDSTSKLINTIIKIPLTPVSLLTSGIATGVKGVVSLFDSFKSVGKLSSKDEKAMEKANDGKINPFSKEYWTINNDHDGLAGWMYNLNSIFSKVTNLPSALIAMVNPVSWLKKLGNWIGITEDEFEKEASNSNSDSGKGSGKPKSGFVSQFDPKYKNKQIGEDETVASAGCGPATAANVINYYSSGKGTMDEAVSVAPKYQDSTGGIRPEYFRDYLGSQGISTNPTMDKTEMINSIASGNPTILLGSDPTNKSNTPYGSASSHYVLATGLDGKGNVIVQDPESRTPNTVYPINDVINQSHLGMITGKGTRKSSYTKLSSRLANKLRGIGFGKGSNTINKDLATFSEISASELNKFISSYAGNNRGFSGKGQLFIDASKESGLDPRYILAHSAVETGWGDSDYAKAGNFFGIGAYNSNPDNALNYANDSMASGLTNGAVWIRKNYYDNGQKTLYQMIHDSKGHNYAVNDDGSPNTAWMNQIAHIMDQIGDGGTAKYHESNGSYSSSSDSSSTSGGLLDKFSNLASSFYKNGLVEALLGGTTSSSDTSSSSSTTVIDSNGDNSELGNDFMKKYNGVAVDYDGKWGAQCADLFKQYMDDYANVKNYYVPGDSAKNIYADPKIDNYFDRLGNDVSKAKVGDWVIWDGDSSNGGYGHVAMFNGYENGYIKSFGTNQGGDGSARVTNISTDKVIGYLRLKSGKGSGKEKLSAPTLDNNSVFNIIKNKGRSISNNTNVLSSYDYDTQQSESLDSRVSGVNSKSYETIKNSLSSRSYVGRNANTTTSTITNQNTNTNNSRTEKLISVVIEVLGTIADNTSKLSEIVSLLSKALDLDLTNDDISNLSSSNSQIKNKIANALKSQGSSNGLGSSVMTSETNALVNALYSIANA